MVVHDMRGPVTSMKIALQQSIDLISQFQNTTMLYADMMKIEEQIAEIWSQVTTDDRFIHMINDILKDLIQFKGTNQEREEAKL